MTFATVLPFVLTAAGGWLARHYQVGSGLLAGVGSLLGKLAGPHPVASPAQPTSPTVPAVTLGNHPVLSDAVNAAILQAVSDVTAGRVSGLKSELASIAEAAAAKAVADLAKPKT